MSEYQPGVCNIGSDQRRARRWSGLASFAVAAAVVVGVAAGLLPPGFSWATAPFLFGGWVGVFQDRFRFCVAFGALARYDFSGSGGSSGNAAEAEAVRADRKRALKILALAAVATAVTTVLAAWLGGAL